MMNTFDEKALCKAALVAMKNSYAPYSSFNVGAALLTSEGKIYTGCNIENGAYTPTVCAERVAVFKAVSEGECSFEAIAVAGGKDGVVSGKTTPCGVCRQVLSEFCSPEFKIYCVSDAEGGFSSHTLAELLPEAFGL